MIRIYSTQLSWWCPERQYMQANLISFSMEEKGAPFGTPIDLINLLAPATLSLSSARCVFQFQLNSRLHMFSYRYLRTYFSASQTFVDRIVQPSPKLPEISASVQQHCLNSCSQCWLVEASMMTSYLAESLELQPPHLGSLILTKVWILNFDQQIRTHNIVFENEV